ncbi:transporter [Croceitalea rosinachiae]|uniref:Transporter n=1 Tax=Croceitalea rosinachiae TaxID=3075596 RepID=A0ABU3AB58_9FLAO|nr:transporter [Croceitalea sp. F388]MDT0607399.1 transporter [Croceitalea sp. F388]
MAFINRLFLAFILLPLFGIAQYTDVINSNRPGLSVSAYAVGKNVVQAEFGFLYEMRDNGILNQDSNIFGGDLSLRYGLLLEKLEVNYEGTYIRQSLTFNNFNLEETRTDFSRNRLGLKYLVYDPFKNPEANKPNLYSWRANHKFQFKNLLPAVSLYGGATFNLGDNPFYPEDGTISYRAMIATQSRLTPRWVLITNVAYDRISTDFPELNYTISLSHAFRNPKWSIFAEHQGIDSDRYSDALIRTGFAYLFNPTFQADFSVGGSFKNTPSRMFVATGVSYRLDFHKDQLVPIEDQDAIGKIKKGSMKKSKPKKVKKKKRKKKKDNIDF